MQSISLKDYEEAQLLKDTGESLGEEDERSVSDLLIDQVEFADVILISKTDLVKRTDIERLTAILKKPEHQGTYYSYYKRAD